jgi:hypothetical protein
LTQVKEATLQSRRGTTTLPMRVFAPNLCATDLGFASIQNSVLARFLQARCQAVRAPGAGN